MGTKLAARDTAVLAERLRRAMARLVRRARQESVGGEVTPSMTSALTAVVTQGSPTLGEIAAAERVSAPTATKVVARLEDAGLVVREQDADDRRVVRVRLTAEGRRFVERTRARAGAYLARRMRTLSDEEQAVLAEALPVLERLLEEP
jgi:DNA-binding MarR family transcriptional regulator